VRSENDSSDPFHFANGSISNKHEKHPLGTAVLGVCDLFFTAESFFSERNFVTNRKLAPNRRLTTLGSPADGQTISGETVKDGIRVAHKLPSRRPILPRSSSAHPYQ
jgi:hypothetical protein